MAKRKKKQSSQGLQKIAQAQHRNEFLRKVKELLLFYLKPQLFAQIPPKVFDYLYSIRYNAPIIAAAAGYQIPKELIKFARFQLTTNWKQSEIPLFKDGPPISVYNCLTVWMTIWTYWNKVTDDDYPQAKKVKETLTPYMDLDELLQTLLDRIYEPAQTICIINSNMGEYLYWAKFEIILNEEKLRVQNRLEIYREITEKRNITIDGNNRPVVRVGACEFYAKGIKWVTISPALLNISSLDPEKPIEVFIQAHALQRLKERLDGIEDWLIYIATYYSLSGPVVVPSGFGYPLIEFRIGKIKVGYFTYIVVEGILVIRTFLFIINNGTPEGKKLQEITGLGRLDKKYLAIDRISSFFSSDISENENIKHILVQCGCENLLHLTDEEGKTIFFDKKSSQRTAQLIEQYLKKPSQEEGGRRKYQNIPEFEMYS